MKTLRSLLPLLIAIAVPVSAFSAAPKNAKKKEYVPIHTTISAVTDTSITTSTNSTDGKHDKTNTYSITPSTEIEVKGGKATAKDLKAGMRVTVTVGNTPDTAAR